jgi:hypothetical protein
MNQVTYQRIKSAALFLGSPEARAAQGYLLRSLETALRICDIIADSAIPVPTTTIARKIGMDVNTVRQILLALIEGGYPLIEKEVGFTLQGKPNSFAITQAKEKLS